MPYRRRLASSPSRVPRDLGELGSLGPPLPCGASHPYHGRGADSSRSSCWGPDARAAGHAQVIVPAVHHDLQQRGLGERVLLPSQRRHRPHTIHKEGADGEDRCLAPQCVASCVAAEVGVAHHRAVAPSKRRTGGGLDHRQLSSSADRPPHEEGALHL
jgi:hypothetical protein